MLEKTKGFTLIEVMIVVVIIAVLASVGYPAYQRHIYKGRQAVAKSALESTRLAMENYKARNGAYPGSGESVTLLGVAEEADTTDVKAKYKLTINSSSAEGFILKAECNIDSDGTLDIWTINQLGTLSNTKNDIAE